MRSTASKKYHLLEKLRKNASKSERCTTVTADTTRDLL